MPKRWERELRRLGEVPAPTERIHARSTRPSEPSSPMPPARQRVVAGVVAFGAFIAAAALFGWQAFSGGGSPAQPAIADDWPVATVTLSSDDSGKSAVLSVGGRTQGGVFGSSTSPDEDYPYRWSNPVIDRAIAVPIGAELRLDGDVRIKEILFGDADELDAGRGPDSGPISSEQPTFEEPYFPVQDQPRREYWKVFGTWADGSVLDVYFEVRWVEPRVDLSDTSVDIVVTRETLEADLLYGGQRRGTMGEGSYGGMSVIGEWAGYYADTLYFPVAAGSTINVVGDDLESWTARIEDRQGPESVESLASIPGALGPTTLRLSVVWGDGTGSFRFPIEIVEPSVATDDVTEKVQLRLSEGLPGATLEYEGMEQVGITSEPFLVVDMYDGHPLPDRSVDDFPYLIQVPPGTEFEVSKVPELDGYTWWPQRSADSDAHAIPGRLGPQVFILRVSLDDDTSYDVSFGVDVVDSPSDGRLTVNDVLGCQPALRFHYTSDLVTTLPVGESYIGANLEGVELDDRVAPMDGEAGDPWGAWSIARDGVTIAWVDYGSLSGVACEGSGIGG
ncbi:MAG: hypothetical protein ACXWZF_11760 [Actinomycetota bacterium]